MPDPILDQALSRVRAEQARTRRQRRTTTTATATALTATLLATGIHLGRTTPQTPTVLTATTESGLHLTTTITPATGWIRLQTTLTGLTTPQPCRLVVTDTTNTPYTAASWLSQATTPDTRINGTAMVDITDLVKITVITTDGRILISAST
ncbi:hypothetical protein [Actinosynnema sp. NPDC020468]|uniref:hypothetical protein n=1 Tax=Actinosynnema sp. NPDC020468 TaxID=3154488 RepID=UPI0033E0F53B